MSSGNNRSSYIGREPDTPFLGLKRPDGGVTDWHVPLNENFGIIDNWAQSVGAGGGGGYAETFRLSDFGGDTPVARRTEATIFTTSVPTDGTYAISGSIEMDTSPMVGVFDGTGEQIKAYGAAILYVGAERLVESVPLVPLTNTATSTQSMSITYGAALTAGTTIELVAFHNASDPDPVAGGPLTLNALGTNPGHTFMSVLRS